MKLKFFKMQAQGNDYVYFDLLGNKLPDLDLSELSIRLSNRHKGIGSDGIVLLLNDPEADVFMRIFNADGSEAKSCGSALRCTTAYLGNLLNKKRIKLNTLSGMKFGEILKDSLIKVNLGQPKLLKKEFFLNDQKASLVQLGNEHCVVKCDELPDNFLLKNIYKLCKNDKSTVASNLEFFHVLTPHEIEISIWERGSGATLACGTGAGAAAFTGLVFNLLNSPVKINMPGGTVQVEYKPPDLFIIGEVDTVYNGEIDV